MTDAEKLEIAIDALNKVLWHKECGCDFYDEKIGKHRNYPDVERDAMYRDALVALKRIGGIRPCEAYEPLRRKVFGDR